MIHTELMCLISWWCITWPSSCEVTTLAQSDPVKPPLACGHGLSLPTDCRSVPGVCLLPAILTLGALGDLACLALAGIWMNMAGNKTNDFYAQLEPYVEFSEGAVSPNSYNELPSSRCSCQRISDCMMTSKPVPYLSTACPKATT